MGSKVVGFVDGENLAIRYKSMLDRGETPHTEVKHIPDVFVWSPGVAHALVVDMVRLSYYTSVVGSPNVVDEVSAQIAGTKYFSGGGTMRDSALQLIPRVYKRDGNGRKVRVVDIAITMDIMRAAQMPSVDGILLLTGDGDFLSLIHEITRLTGKQMFIGALSLGCSPALRSCADRFIDLDPIFFSSIGP